MMLHLSFLKTPNCAMKTTTATKKKHFAAFFKSLVYTQQQQQQQKCFIILWASSQWFVRSFVCLAIVFVLFLFCTVFFCFVWSITKLFFFFFARQFFFSSNVCNICCFFSFHFKFLIIHYCQFRNKQTKQKSNNRKTIDSVSFLLLSIIPNQIRIMPIYLPTIIIKSEFWFLDFGFIHFFILRNKILLLTNNYGSTFKFCFSLSSVIIVNVIIIIINQINRKMFIFSGFNIKKTGFI